MIELHHQFLEYLEKEEDVEENYRNLEQIIKNNNIKNDQHKLKTFLYLISKVAKNHYRCLNFIEKIQRILINLKSFIMKHFSNLEIFNFFKGNKLIIIFLIQEKILKISRSILNRIKNDNSLKLKYIYLIPEIVEFIIKEENAKKYDNILDKDSIFELYEITPEDFIDKRKIGENDKYICELIREDSIEKFITYVKKENFSLKTKIHPSVYESNSMLINATPSLIEYAAFFGSIQIFKYLYLNKIDLSPSIWIYGIHGDNPEIFHILEEQKINFENEKALEEAIKCHHNHIANYIQNNLFIKKNKDANNEKNILEYAFHYYNFAFFTKENFNHFIFFYACKYDYFTIVDFFNRTRKLYLRETIENHLFFK